MEKKIKSRFTTLILLLGCMILIYPSAGLTVSYISIDPVGDHTIGEQVNVTGTTNLPVNSTLVVQAGPRVFTNYEPNYFFKTVQVSNGKGIQDWLVVMNTSTFTTGEYNLTVDRVEGSSLANTTRFTMIHDGINHQPTIDPLPTSVPTTPAIIKNPTGTSETAIPTTPRPASLPGIASIVALGCVVLIAFSRKGKC
jgi:hypothetical protein